MIKLKENRDFRRAYTRGKPFVSAYTVVYVTKNRVHAARMGITAGKKIGNAVSRNRAKRVITAAYRTCLAHIKPGYDVVIVARTRILAAKSTEVAAALKKQLSAAGLWTDGQKNENRTD